MNPVTPTKRPMRLRITPRRALAAAILVPALTFAVSRDARDGVAGFFAPEAEAATAVRLRVDISQRKLSVVRDGDVSRTYSVAVGTKSYPTPRGTFTIRKIVWNPGWVPPDSDWARDKSPKGPGDDDNPMRVAKIFFREPDYYIHGTPHVSSLGSAASHGCLRMSPNSVAELAHQVMNAGGVARDWSWVKSTLRLGKTRTVHLKRPVTITVTS